MKYIFWIFVLILLSCDNELDINDTWTDIPIIYSILDPGVYLDADGSEDVFLSSQYEGQPNVSFKNGVYVIDFGNDNNDNDDLNKNHYVRVQKSFLGSGAASDYSDIKDSVHYNSSDIDVFVQLVNKESGQLGDTIMLELVEGLINDGTSFYSGEYDLYKFPSAISDLDNIAGYSSNNSNINQIGYNYRISVYNKITGEYAYGQTEIIEPLAIKRPRAADASLTTDNSELSKLIRIPGNSQYISVERSKYGKMYEVSLRFKYIEQTRSGYLTDSQNAIDLYNFGPKTDTIHKYIDYTLEPRVLTEQQMNDNSYGTELEFYIYESAFYEFVRSQISEQDLSSPNLYRYPRNMFPQATQHGIPAGLYPWCIDLSVTVIDNDLYTYIKAGEPTTGFNQERPSYNNIINGVGHVSSRSVLKMNNLRIDKNTRDVLAGGPITNNLNFSCYDRASLSVEFGYDCTLEN